MLNLEALVLCTIQLSDFSIIRCNFKMNNQNSRSPPPRRCYFRVLRTDENIQEIVPKAKKNDVNKYAHEKMEDLVVEHIRGGSKFGFNSSLISLTGMNGIITCSLIIFYDMNIAYLINNNSFKTTYLSKYFS